MSEMEERRPAKAANPANQFAPLASLAPLAGDPLPAARDPSGRFQTGNSGGGRPKGSRNKLTEKFLDTISDDFAEHGAEALAALRKDDPASYLRMVGSLIPRELILKREQSPPINFDEITDEQLFEIAKQRKRQKYVESFLQSIV